MLSWLQALATCKLNPKYPQKQEKNNITLSITFIFQSPLSFDTHRNTEFIRESYFGLIL